MSAENFPHWWELCQQKNNDGNAQDTGSPTDPPTRWGFTFPTWTDAQRYIRSSHTSFAEFMIGTQDDMSGLALAYFWQRQGCNLMPPGYDVVTMDWLWTSGGAPSEIQRRLGLTGREVDGAIGPKTVSKAMAYGDRFMVDLTQWRCAYYNQLGLQKDRGLYRRAAETLLLAYKITGIRP